MRLTKKILSSNVVQYPLCFLAYLYINFVYFTCKWEYQGKERIEKIWLDEVPIIMAFWHGRLLMVPKFQSYKSFRTHVLISDHKDGELIAKVAKFLGFNLVRGSTKKNAIRALKDCFSVLRKGNILAITPDGPRGPRMKVGGNVAKIALKMDVPIIPITYSIKRHKVLKSWDRFMIALPFSRGICIFGDPIIPKKNNEKADLELKNALEKALNDITCDADKLMGVDPVLLQR